MYVNSLYFRFGKVDKTEKGENLNRQNKLPKSHYLSSCYQVIKVAICNSLYRLYTLLAKCFCRKILAIES